MRSVMRRTGSYKWLLVISLAVMVNVGYGAMFYAFSVLLGEDAAARELSRRCCRPRWVWESSSPGRWPCWSECSAT
jgi:hypothetical protein